MDTMAAVSASLDWTFDLRNSTFAIPMFPLRTNTFPSTAADLERLLNESLQQGFDARSPPVAVRDRAYPQLESITVSLDGASLRPDSPRPSPLSGETEPALEINQFTLSASPLSLGPVALDLSMAGRNVHLRQGRDADGQIVLSLDRAAEGKIEISLAHADLEALVLKLAQDQAEKQGITVDGVQLELRQKDARSLSVEVRLRARKLFLAASIQVTGQLELDDQLNLRIFDLNCRGDGGIANIACGILKPHLEKMDGREISLLTLPLGEVRLRDVQLAVGDRLSVTAEFGSAS